MRSRRSRRSACCNPIAAETIVTHPESAGVNERRPGAIAGLRSLIYNDVTAAVLLIAFCGFVYYLSTQIRQVPDALAQGMQPASYPQGVLVFIVAFTAMMLFESRARPLDVPEPVPGLAYATMAAMVAALIVSTWVDFFLGIILFVIVCVPLWGMRRYLLATLYAIAVAAVLYLLFGVFLSVRFPSGVISNLVSRLVGQ